MVSISLDHHATAISGEVFFFWGGILLEVVVLFWLRSQAVSWSFKTREV